MSDPRCTCGESSCPICTAPAHQPWVPKPGVDRPDIAAMMAEDAEERAAIYARWERWQTIRRYLLVLLLTGLGSMIGSAITILTFLYYN